MFALSTISSEERMASASRAGSDSMPTGKMSSQRQASKTCFLWSGRSSAVLLIIAEIPPGANIRHLLQQLDFVGGQIEQAINPAVQFGFGVVQGAGEPGILVPLFPQIRLPFISGPWVLQGIGLELEALL